MAETLHDIEFGTVRIRRTAWAKYIRLRIRSDGTLSVTLPRRAALKHAKTLIDDSRESIRSTWAAQPKKAGWSDGDAIGAVYRLVVKSDAMVAGCTTSLQGTNAIVLHNPAVSPADLQSAIRAFVKKLLRKQATAYIPRRLDMLAEKYGFHYETVRFSNAETRWGSCSSKGTISLNIWLMTLPLELIEYVLLHELAHTRHMNHSGEFWQTMEDCLADYKVRRKELKNYNPAP